MEQKKNKVDYQKGLIYLIYYENRLIYVGSTTNLRSRKRNHKIDFKYCKSLFCKKLKEENIQFEDLRFEELEKFPCNSKNELERHEGIRQRELKPEFNKRIEGRTKKEYYEDNKDYIINKSKIYVKENKEKVAQYKKEYYFKNIDKIKEYKKIYQQKNKEQISIKSKIYAEKNKEKVLEKRKEKIICECGIKLYKTYWYKHIKTNKHINLLKKNKPNN